MKNKQKIKAIIFDMDGTLYSFDDEATGFRDSRFGKTVFSNIEFFIMQKLGLSLEDAVSKMVEVKNKYKVEISIGLEKEFGINRSEYFEATWNLEPNDFLQQDEELKVLLASLNIPIVLLTAAPKVWATKVLQFLQVDQLFGNAIFTGDPDLRKPDPKVFIHIANFLQIEPQSIVSIGDQEKTDILPAQSIGMKTIKIGVEETSEADFMVASVFDAIAVLRKEYSI